MDPDDLYLNENLFKELYIVFLDIIQIIIISNII